MSRHYSIILVDDHVVVRSGLKELIERTGNYIVKHQFGNGQELIDSIPFSEQPDLIIMDLNMPVMDGKQTAEWLKQNNILYPVLILTIDTTDKTIIELFKLGVRGYLPKSCTASVLKKAIDDVLNAGYYHSELLTQALITDGSKHKDDDKEEMMDQITEKEMAFLRYVCDEKEYTYEQIADMMGVHRRTVDGYREAIFNKFNIKSKSGLVLFAIKYRIIEIPAKI